MKLKIEGSGSKFWTQSGKPRFLHMAKEMCFDCCGGFWDGKVDCQIQDCPLYCLQPYRRLEPDFSWRITGSHLKVNRIAYKYGIKPSGNGADMPKLNKYGRPPKSEIIRAFCCQCMGHLVDGHNDCQIYDCPFYCEQPYRKMEPDYWWVEGGLRLSKNRMKFRNALNM